MHYIYHIPGVKIGCTKDIERRMSEQGFSDWEILEQHVDPQVAGDREWELQDQYGFPRDKIHYMVALENREIGARKGRAKILRTRTKEEKHEIAMLGYEASKGKWSKAGGAASGKIVGNREHVCPHCSKKVKGPGFFRWHGENCKHKE